MRGQRGGCARPSGAILLGTLLGLCAPGVRAGSPCPDPAQANAIGSPGGLLQAAGESESWAPGTPFTAPTSATVDGTTPFGGILHAEMTASPAFSFGFPMVISFELTGEQGVAINGVHSRLDWPLEIDLPGLADGQSLVLSYELAITSALSEGSGTRTATLTLQNGSAPLPQDTIGPLTGAGQQATGQFAGAVHTTLPEFRLRLLADAFVAAPGGKQAISGVLRVTVRTTGDFDGDGLSDVSELDGADGLPASGDESDPGRFDSDNDGEDDAAELLRGGAPLDACDVVAGSAQANCLEVAEVLSWRAITGCGTEVVTYDLYRGRLDVLHAGGPYTQPPGGTGEAFCDLTEPSMADDAPVLVGEPLFWLVTAARDGVDSTLGFDSGGQVRPNANPCP